MTQKLVTASDIAKALDTTVQTVQKRLDGLDHVLLIGRSKVYDLAAVQDHIWSQHTTLLAFLGLPVSRETSYDVSVDQDTETLA